MIRPIPLNTRNWASTGQPRPDALDTRDWKKWHEEHPYVAHPRTKNESAKEYDARLKADYQAWKDGDKATPLDKFHDAIGKTAPHLLTHDEYTRHRHNVLMAKDGAPHSRAALNAHFAAGGSHEGGSNFRSEDNEKELTMATFRSFRADASKPAFGSAAWNAKYKVGKGKQAKKAADASSTDDPDKDGDDDSADPTDDADKSTDDSGTPKFGTPAFEAKYGKGKKKRDDEDGLDERGLKTADQVADKDGVQPADSGDTSVAKHAFQGDDPQKCSKCGLAKTAKAHEGQRGDDGWIDLTNRDDGPHRFGGHNVAKCAKCGKSMKNADHKQSWPPSWRAIPNDMEYRNWAKWNADHPYVPHPRQKGESAKAYDKRLTEQYNQYLTDAKKAGAPKRMTDWMEKIQPKTHDEDILGKIDAPKVRRANDADKLNLKKAATGYFSRMNADDVAKITATHNKLATPTTIGLTRKINRRNTGAVPEKGDTLDHPLGAYSKSPGVWKGDTVFHLAPGAMGTDVNKHLGKADPFPADQTVLAGGKMKVDRVENVGGTNHIYMHQIDPTIKPQSSTLMKTPDGGPLNVDKVLGKKWEEGAAWRDRPARGFDPVLGGTAGWHADRHLDKAKKAMEAGDPKAAAFHINRALAFKNGTSLPGSDFKVGQLETGQVAKAMTESRRATSFGDAAKRASTKGPYLDARDAHQNAADHHMAIADALPKDQAQGHRDLAAAHTAAAAAFGDVLDGDGEGRSKAWAANEAAKTVVARHGSPDPAFKRSAGQILPAYSRR